MNTFTDYYALLEVPVDAEPSVIKAAFKKLALQYHPDVYAGSDANERMSQLLEAYQTLSDPLERKQYDARRSEHLLDERGGRSYQAPPSHAAAHPADTVRPRGGKVASGEVTPGARRDRQRHYAFPALTSGKPARINLVDFDYTLAPADAGRLALDGMLRGVAPKASQGQYFCHRCHHRWQAGHKQPRYCPNCHSLDWPEFLLLRCVHCNAVFESEQIRYEIGSYSYGSGRRDELGGLCPPYELFPLCPYCGRARWSPAEDQRVADLRHKANQKALLMRTLWIGVGLLLVLLIALVALGGHL